MLAGLIRDDEREIKEGVPGLSDLPVLGQIFGRTHKEATETDIILTLTPHIVRVLDLHEADLAPFRLGREGTATPTLDLPGGLPGAVPPPAVPIGPDQNPPPPANRPVLPILPPEPTPPAPPQPNPTPPQD
jgi:general secretion pathway protein D